jgi:hypothetical protein
MGRGSEEVTMKARAGFACLILLIALFAAGRAAPVAAEAVGRQETGHAQTAGGDGCGDWRKEDFGEFSLCMPKELKPSKGRAYDLGYYYFVSEDYKLNLAVGPNAYGPAGKGGLPTYKHESLLINEAKVWLWSYELDLDGDGFRYHVGARFTSKEPDKFTVTIELRSKDQSVKETARKIFNSVVFKSK